MKVEELKKLFYVQEVDPLYYELKARGMTFLCHEEFMHDEVYHYFICFLSCFVVFLLIENIGIIWDYK